jgi:glycerol-3-phosphate dehydrogenase
MEAVNIVESESSVAGITAIDTAKGGNFEFRASSVVNATGPWCAELANKMHGTQLSAPRNSLAWNVLFGRPAVSNYAVAVSRRSKGGQTYFMVPWHGRLLAGTGHGPWHGDPQNPRPSEQQLLDFLAELNAAAPKLYLRLDDIVRIFAGLVPANDARSYTPSEGETIIDHSRLGGPAGLFSVLGVKFTTARTVASKVLSHIRNGPGSETASKSRDRATHDYVKRYDWQWAPSAGDRMWLPELRRLVVEESVQHLDDLVIRRTGLGDDPCRALEVAPDLCQLFDWDEKRSKLELDRLRSQLGCYQPVKLYL